MYTKSRLPPYIHYTMNAPLMHCKMWFFIETIVSA